MSFLQFLAEELHPELFKIIDGANDITKKHENITKHIRKLISSGVDTGLEGSRAKKGSSRAVYFPKDDKEVNIDNKNVKIKTALKIAFPGDLDYYDEVKRHGMLGELQNEAESSNKFNNHSILKRDSNNNFVTNEEYGVLAPIINTSHDNSWLEMGRVKNITKAKFKELTKTKEHPNGIGHRDLARILINEHRLKYGKGNPEYNSEEKSVLNHPLTQKLKHLINNTDLHPNDIFDYTHVGDNFGVWTHPITGKEYPVIRDYGFTDKVHKEYNRRMI